MGNTSIIGYFWQAGFVVKSVMLILLFSSIASWTLIIQRAWFFKRIQAQYDYFTRRFWECTDLSKLFADLDSRPEDRQGVASIFHAGFREFLRLHQQGKVSLEPIERGMQIHYGKEALDMEQHLSFFSLVGSVSPYVGLFGTVWGIMASLQALGQAQQATIAMVAPGISEALVATALGLFTAIPAVIAYQRYSAKASSLLERYDLFQEELLALISEQH